MSYYLVVSGWTLGYAVDALRLDLKTFDEFTSGYNTLWLFLATAVLTGIMISRGLSGLERLSRVLLPTPKLLDAINAPTRRLGPLSFSPRWIIQVGRYLPAAAVIMLVVTYLF